MHHGCRYRENDMDHPLLGKSKRKPTMVGKGEDGHLRCCECKRKVVAKNGQTYAQTECPPLLEAPYPSGWCTYPPEWYEDQQEVTVT